MDVVAADDGDVALQWLIDSYSPDGPQPVDLVLMDSTRLPLFCAWLFVQPLTRVYAACAVQMPRMDGVTATRRFRAWEREQRPDAPRVPIIALSANVFDEAIEECHEAGMDGAPESCGCCRGARLTRSMPLAVPMAGFVPKPLRLDMLRAALATRLRI